MPENVAKKIRAYWQGMSDPGAPQQEITNAVARLIDKHGEDIAAALEDWAKLLPRKTIVSGNEDVALARRLGLLEDET